MQLCIIVINWPEAVSSMEHSGLRSVIPNWTEEKDQTNGDLISARLLPLLVLMACISLLNFLSSISWPPRKHVHCSTIKYSWFSLYQRLAISCRDQLAIAVPGQRPWWLSRVPPSMCSAEIEKWDCERGGGKGNHESYALGVVAFLQIIWRWFQSCRRRQRTS